MRTADHPIDPMFSTRWGSSEALAAREVPNDRQRLAELAFEGTFGEMVR